LATSNREDLVPFETEPPSTSVIPVWLVQRAFVAVQNDICGKPAERVSGDGKIGEITLFLFLVLEDCLHYPMGRAITVALPYRTGPWRANIQQVQ
jgi:hypothetical protein